MCELLQRGFVGFCRGDKCIVGQVRLDKKHSTQGRDYIVTKSVLKFRVSAAATSVIARRRIGIGLCGQVG